MSIIVIFCQTCFGLVVAQDAEILVGGLGEARFVEDIVSSESSDVGDSLDIMSDIVGQDQLVIVDISADELIEAQSGIDITSDIELGSVADLLSNGSGGLLGSGSLDTSGETLIIELTQTSIGQGIVEQNLPETAYSSDENDLQVDILSLPLMTSFALPNPSPQLSITEVRIDGTDEYIELTNRGNPFIGSVSISGVKTSGLLNVVLDLGTNESVVIGDTLAMITGLGFNTLSNQSLSMTDTVARSLQLIYSGDMIDTLDLSATQVVGSDNQSSSREYDFVQQIWQVTSLTHNANIVSGHRGNPGVVRGLTVTGSNLTGDISTGSTNTGLIGTGIVSTGVITMGVVATGSSNIGSIQISQVYPFSDCMGEYLALSFSSSYSGSLTIAGLGTSDTSKTFDISAQSGSMWYVVESISGVLSDNVIVVPNITLTDSGEPLVLINMSGEALDSILYSSTQMGKVSAFTNISGTTRLFNTNIQSTLLTSCNMPMQLPQIGGCRISTTGELYTTGSFSASFNMSGSLVDSACGSSFRLVDGATVTTNSCALGSSFAPGSHRIVYQQYSGSTLICEDEYMFYGAIHQTVTANVVTTTSNGSYYESLYHKRKLDYDELVVAVEYLGLVVTDDNNVYGTCDQALLSGDRLASMYDPAKPLSLIRIGDAQALTFTSIIADGTGRDSDGTERIEFLNETQDRIDLSNLTIVVNNRKVVDLTGSVGPKSYITLTDYFPIPNSAGCVAIYSLDGGVYDQVCYGRYKEEHLIDIEFLKVPKKKVIRTTSSSTGDMLTKKSCLQLEEYELFELDIREQKLINKAQKVGYQHSIQKIISLYRQKSDQLYQTYRDITDKKQSYINTQQQYIEKLQGQLASSRQYATTITQLYRSSKSYNTTLSNSNTQCRQEQSYIKSAYPAIYQDSVLGSDDTDINQAIEPDREEEQSWWSTTQETVSNLF